MKLSSFPDADHAHVRAGRMDELHARPRSTKKTAAATTSTSSSQSNRDVPAAGAAYRSRRGDATRRLPLALLAPLARRAPPAPSTATPAGMNAKLHAAEPHVRRAVEPALTRDRATRRRTCRSSSSCPPRTSHRPAAASFAWISLTLSSVSRTSLFAPRPTWARGVRIAYRTPFDGPSFSTSSVASGRRGVSTTRWLNSVSASDGRRRVGAQHARPPCVAVGARRRRRVSARRRRSGTPRRRRE